ncbi:MAG: AAA family ATPase [Lachnospiraceae bacterium]|nr:AAA family ATPase [Lachnospiraceae bacterium]
MSRRSCIRVGYFLAPQDRRKIGEKQIHEYILDHYRSVFKERIFGIENDAGKTIVFNIMDIEKEQVEELALELVPKLDLTESSFYVVTDLYDRVEAVSGDTDGQETDDEKTQALKEVEQLVGVEDFKALCRRIAAVSESGDALILKERLSGCAFLFSVSGGDGFTRYLQLLSRILGLLDTERGNCRILEVKKAESYERMVDIMEDTDHDGEMVSFDLTYKMDKADTGEFRGFIRKMRKKCRDKVPVFKIPYSEGREKESLIRAVSSVFTLIVIDVEPFTTEQYSKYAIQKLSEKRFKIENKAKDELCDLIVQKRNEKHFYGFHSVNNLVNEIIYQKMLAQIRGNKKMSLVIREKDLMPMIEKCRAEQGGLNALDEMIGIDEVKERIDEIIVQLELAKNLPPEEKPAMHMLFTGNPGTGKTTVARLLGKILKEKNVLSRGRFFERSGRELVGKYIGETAPITNSICRDAYGSVLFIDEAYTLYHADDGKDFGKEALDTLLTQMENHRQDFIVIFSGYSDRMKEMLEANPGLKSRIPHEVKFRNFTREELFDIYMSMAAKLYRYTDDLAKEAGNYFLSLSEELIENESFSNARFVRNLYERTVSKAALRLQAASGGRNIDGSKITLTGEDFRKASEASEFKDLMVKKSRFGFQ